VIDVKERKEETGTEKMRKLSNEEMGNGFCRNKGRSKHAKVSYMCIM
jgi:hypothetical protein